MNEFNPSGSESSQQKKKVVIITISSSSDEENEEVEETVGISKSSAEQLPPGLSGEDNSNSVKESTTPTPGVASDSIKVELETSNPDRSEVVPVQSTPSSSSSAAKEIQNEPSKSPLTKENEELKQRMDELKHMISIQEEKLKTFEILKDQETEFAREKQKAFEEMLNLKNTVDSLLQYYLDDSTSAVNNEQAEAILQLQQRVNTIDSKFKEAFQEIETKAVQIKNDIERANELIGEIFHLIEDGD